MNEQRENKVEWTISNFLAVAGFVVLVILLAWLAINLVRLIPGAFASLANLFESNQQALEEDFIDDNEEPVATNDDETPSPSEEEESEEEEVATSTPVAPVKPAPTKPKPTTPVKPQYQTVATYVVPTSDPNGYTDLEISFVAVGEMSVSERFIPTTELSRKELGAMQFRVKNIGTKTSGDWHFTAELPDGDDMKSPGQRPLKPGEMSTLTITFVTGNIGRDSVGATVIGGNDTKLNNNSFSTNVYVR